MSRHIEVIAPDDRDKIRKIGFVHFMSISTFAASMGYCGMCFGWRMAHELWGVPAVIGEFFGFCALLFYILIFSRYFHKWRVDSEAVRAEWDSPTKINFFGTFNVSTVLLAAVLAPYTPTIASIFWYAGLILIMVFSWILLEYWLYSRQQVESVTPAWILAVLGPITIPIAGNVLQNPGYHDISIFCVAIGLVTGIPLIFLLFAHSLFAKNMTANAVQPSLMILMAPFGMGYITYTQTFAPDTFTVLFINAGIFLFWPIAIKILYVMRHSPFCMGWWACSFPTMAFTNGVLHYSVDHPVLWTKGLGIFLLLFGTSLILYLSFKTIWAAVHKTLWKLY
ncbi:C4-dicarboxylate ABC transporter [uncultured Megasphaera sp.]|uniref:SLAC1 family transporter n=1 Tax=uncultured Megasphaera sp. TaxID=165188 RepID=UPI002658676E|nr:C4-dicarboxylate ABC transporter [uncultured Megasphaera sp.]